jgi:hypothetical protein
MTFPESLINSLNPPSGLEVNVQKFRPVGQDREEWVVAVILELENGNSNFFQTSIPFEELSSGASQSEVGVEAARRMEDDLIAWVDEHKDAEPIEGNTYTT